MEEPTFLPLGTDLLAVDGVAAVQCTEVALYGELPIYYRVFGEHVRLVEVIGVLHVCPTEPYRTKTEDADPLLLHDACTVAAHCLIYVLFSISQPIALQHRKCKVKPIIK